MRKVIFHIDMNNFYASVECLLNKELSNYALAVAGNPYKRTGIILAKNYIAKAYGIKTGDVIWEAKQKCPGLIVVAPHFEKYEEFSKKAFNIYSKYTDLIEPFGIDECWLDVTRSLKFFNKTPKELAKTIQDDVYSSLGLSVSIGISFGKTLAKLGSDMKKPRGLTVIDENNYLSILKRLNIQDMIMIGKKTGSKLKSFNVNTLLDLYNLNKSFLSDKFGLVGEFLYGAVRGKDDTLLPPSEEGIKSVGNGETAVKDMISMSEIIEFLHKLSTKISRRLRSHSFRAKVIHLTIKYADFSYSSCQYTVNYYFSNEQDIFDYALKMFKELAGQNFSPVRAIRICTSGLIKRSADIQVNLFKNEKNEHLCEAIDNLKQKFGDDIISFANNFED